MVPTKNRDSPTPQPVVFDPFKLGWQRKQTPFPKLTLVTIRREGFASVTLKVPEHIDWFDVVQRCAKEFGK
jgi:hypothetical protein